MEKDILSKEFFSSDERYADLINGLGFQGRQIVKKEDLQERDTQTCVRKMPSATKKNNTKLKNRDLIRKIAFGVNFAVIGIENQEAVDYALPLRSMIYDAGEYDKQAAQIRKTVRKDSVGLNAGEYLYGFKKNSRLYPTVTFILYYGKEEWDGAKDLYGILNFDEIPLEIKKLVQNYKVHIIEVRKLKDTTIFKTDIRQVFDFIRYSEDPQKLKELVEHDEAYQSMEEDAYDMVAAYTDTKGLVNMKKYHKKGEKVNMCGAISALVAEGEMKGVEKGIESGIKALIETCREFNISQEETFSQIIAKFNISTDDTEIYMNKYWKETDK